VESDQKKKYEPDAIDRISFVLALVVCLTILYGNVKPEVENYGTTQVYETECWVPEGASFTTDEEAWRELDKKLNAQGYRVNIDPRYYKQLLGNEGGHSVLVTKDTAYYLAESGKAVFTTSMVLPNRPRIGDISKVTYIDNNTLEWRVEFNPKSLVTGIFRGLLMGIMIGALTFFIWALIILILIHVYKTLLNIRKLVFRVV